MFSSQKRIFAGKASLLSDPFCPYVTDASGRQSLLRQYVATRNQAGDKPHARPSARDGKHHG